LRIGRIVLLGVAKFNLAQSAHAHDYSISDSRPNMTGKRWTALLR
jgi:hypothetical protein